MRPSSRRSCRCQHRAMTADAHNRRLPQGRRRTAVVAAASVGPLWSIAGAFRGPPSRDFLTRACVELTRGLRTSSPSCRPITWVQNSVASSTLWMLQSRTPFVRDLRIRPILARDLGVQAGRRNVKRRRHGLDRPRACPFCAALTTGQRSARFRDVLARPTRSRSPRLPDVVDGKHARQLLSVGVQTVSRQHHP